MNGKLENEKIIQKFLLGEMPEEERFEFEEKFITDNELFDEIEATEDELIEKYVRGWMNEAERSKFEQNFLTTKKRRERVEFSRQFIKKIEAEAELLKKNEDETSEYSVWQKLSSLFLTRKFAVATSFVVLISVFGSWILYQNSGKKNEIVKNENSNVSEILIPTPEITPEKTPQIFDDNQNGKTNVNSEKNSIETPTPTPAKSNETIKKTPTPQKIPIQKKAPNPVLALFSGTVRSEGKNNVLNLPKDAKGATLQLNFESVDYKNFKAELNDAEGNTVFENVNLRSGSSKINVFIPARNLKRGDYIIKLYGKNSDGKFESIADFQFRVSK